VLSNRPVAPRVATNGCQPQCPRARRPHRATGQPDSFVTVNRPATRPSYRERPHVGVAFSAGAAIIHQHQIENGIFVSSAGRLFVPLPGQCVAAADATPFAVAVSDKVLRTRIACVCGLIRILKRLFPGVCLHAARLTVLPFHLHAARHAALASTPGCLRIMLFPKDAARVANSLYRISSCPFRLQHAIGYGGGVDVGSPGLHASTSAISISLRSNWLTRSLRETPLRAAIAERRICSSGSR
jgi:hypothetical protein